MCGVNTPVILGLCRCLAGAIEALVTGYALPLRAVSPLEGGKICVVGFALSWPMLFTSLMQSSLLFLILGLLFYKDDVKCSGNEWGRRHGDEGNATR